MTKKDVIDDYLAANEGKTLLVIGHIEKGHFAMRDVDGRLLESHSVPGLVKRAQEKGVLLIPIGCESAQAGAPFGFAKNITTADAAAILRALPKDNPTIGDLLVAFRQAGQTVQIEFAGTRSVFELAIARKEGSNASIRMQLPRLGNPNPNLSSQSSTLSSSSGPTAQAPDDTAQLIATIEARAVVYQSWWEKGIPGAMLSWINSFPWLLIFLGGVALFLLTGALQMLLELVWFYRTKRRAAVAARIGQVQTVLFLTSLLMLVSATIYSFFWDLVLGFVIVSLAIVWLFNTWAESKQLAKNTTTAAQPQG